MDGGLLLAWVIRELDVATLELVISNQLAFELHSIRNVGETIDNGSNLGTVSSFRQQDQHDLLRPDRNREWLQASDPFSQLGFSEQAWTSLPQRQ